MIYLTADHLFEGIVEKMIKSKEINENTPIDIATYSMYVDITKGKDWSETYGKNSARRFLDQAVKMSNKTRLIVGVTYFQECKSNCRECREKYNEGLNRITDTFNIIGRHANIQGRVHPTSHLKYYRIGKRIWIGGINLTASNWVDVAQEVLDEGDKKTLMNIYEQHWNESTTNVDAYKK